MIRVVWLEGRIAAGLGRFEEARALLGQARREFAARQMGYDVALALLEEAALLLEEGQIKMLARELAAVFDSQGEALATLRLFQKAAEREEATAELARRILRFLYCARYDQGLRFESMTRQKIRAGIEMEARTRSRSLTPTTGGAAHHPLSYGR